MRSEKGITKKKRTINRSIQAKADGSDLTRLTFTGAYNAEATVSKEGRIVFTSLREGDLDIFFLLDNCKTSSCWRGTCKLLILIASPEQAEI